MGIAAFLEKAGSSMITDVEIKRLVRHAMPDAQVEAYDRTGTQDHYNVRVLSTAFTGKSLLDQHRMVYDALSAAMQDGRLHAVELKTEVMQ